MAHSKDHAADTDQQRLASDKETNFGIGYGGHGGVEKDQRSEAGPLHEPEEDYGVGYGGSDKDRTLREISESAESDGVDPPSSADDDRSPVDPDDRSTPRPAKASSDL